MSRPEKNKAGLENVYKWVTIFTAITLTSIVGTVATISYLKETVKEGVTDGIAVLVEDVKYLKEKVGDHDKKISELKTTVAEHTTLLSVLKIDLKNTQEKLSTQFIDGAFMKPEELELKTNKKPK